jgi:hypothetical protein
VKDTLATSAGSTAALSPVTAAALSVGLFALLVAIATILGGMTGVFINGAAETNVAATDPKTVDALFDTTTYVGAVKDAADT